MTSCCRSPRRRLRIAIDEILYAPTLPRTEFVELANLGQEFKYATTVITVKSSTNVNPRLPGWRQPRAVGRQRWPGSADNMRERT